MENALIYTALGFGGLAFVLALFLFISRSRLQEKLIAAEHKLTLEQSRLAEVTTKSYSAKQKSEPKPSPEHNKHTAELVELRKVNSHQKDEIRNLKAALRDSERHIKDADNRSENSVFKLRADHAALLERLKDIEQNSPDKKRANQLEQELSDLRTRAKEAQQELTSALGKLKGEKAHAERQKQQIDALQAEVRLLKTRLPEGEQTSSNNMPKIDPKQLERWKDRALTARHMYKMMRQMRELSDIKLSTYQDAVVEVAETLLQMKGITVPVLAPNENKADRFLAEAWALVHPNSGLLPTSDTEAPSNT